ncbi:tripartite tricarboxylate transporter substrate binding protein [Roseomonas sp. OT10]|uniref:Bug family tripartite tricarboxylate transporter substrate binding protein n=1 Tax=Roseomonas cutis TaxID=2897332 RepID=UPI001E4D56B1|nr:tripartite tricarboxylate transporter substrate binding protein [Roseomonas sp. OT10]UFN47249.1 tripartite tricarboxylate transporter substrate binding protein [Roseomonas sp. OT10]
MPMTRRFLGTALTALPLLAVRGARAEGPAWPQRPVRVIVPFPAGTTPDISARPVAQHFAKVFGQPFVVENRSGAGGTIGVTALAQAEDGHTIGLANAGTIATAGALYPNLRYDPARDLRPVALLTASDLVLVVGPAVRARRLADFVAEARKAPEAISYASVGIGSAGHLGMEELSQREGSAMNHVVYRGFPAAAIDLVAGRVGAMICPVTTVLEAVRQGQATALASTAATRTAQLPEVPTLVESGMAGFVLTGWNGLFVPSAMPQAVSNRLGEEACRALAEPQTRATLEAAGFTLSCDTPAAFARFVADETERWGGLVRRLGLRVEL